MTKPQKTLRQLAEESWLGLEPILLEDMRMKMKLYQLGFVHGHKLGKESQSGVRTKPTKK